jgi:hypothetical protein
MEFGKTLLLPSYSRQPHFTSLKTPDLNYCFGCSSCGAALLFSYDEIISESWRWRERYGDDFVSTAKEHFGIGVVGKSHDGGWPSMVIIECGACKTRYLVYAGVDEFYNSLHTVTVQGITEIFNS